MNRMIERSASLYIQICQIHRDLNNKHSKSRKLSKYGLFGVRFSFGGVVQLVDKPKQFTVLLNFEVV